MLLTTLLANFKFEIQQIRAVSSSTVAITKVHRLLYCRVYPTLLVQPDGSTINIHYHEPRKIIRVSIIHLKLLFVSFKKIAKIDLYQ